MKSKLNEERRKATPETADLESAKEVWKNGEVAPSGGTPPARETGPLGRVADAGNIGSGSPSVYGTEIQAEIVGTFTKRSAPRGKKAPQK